MSAKCKGAWCLLAAGIILAGPALAQDRNDSAVFVIDTSETIVRAKAIPQIQSVTRSMANKFPGHVKSAGALVFGNLANPQSFWIDPVKDFNRASLEQALAGIKAGNGSTPMALGIDKSDEGLSRAQGKKALIIVSDGKDNGAKCPVDAVKALNSKYSGSLCVYTILVGNSKPGDKLMTDLAAVTGCGKKTNLSDLQSDAGAQALVDLIFSGKAAVAAAPAPAPAPVEEPKPAPKKIGDADKDGVKDDVDQCPNTPSGANVDSRGCWVLENLRFKTGSAEILLQYRLGLDAAIAVLKNNPNIKVQIEGHTDSIGNPKSNQLLSENRAKAVKDYMVNNGIDASRLAAKGFGASKPAADNATEEGRAQNRRVELSIVK